MTARRLIGLDGLRGALALSVILVHTLGAVGPRVLEVTHLDLLGQVIVIFFVMSGFLIYWPFASRIIAEKDLPPIRDYLRNRALRVYPAYLVIFLLANLALGAVFVGNAMESIEPYTDAGTGRITNPFEVLLHLTLLQNYLPSGLQTGINSSWTLTAEVTFYAILPLLAIAAVAIGRRVRINRYVLAALPGILLLVVGLLCRVASVVAFALSDISLLEAEWGATWNAVFARSFPVWADNFGAGMVTVVVFLAASRGAIDRVGRIPLRTVAGVVFAAGLALAAAALVVDPRFISAAVAIASGGFLLLVLLPTRSRPVPRLARVLDVPPLLYVGLVSLSVYLWHYPVLVLLIRLGWIAPDTPLGALVNVALVAVLSVALGSVTYWLVERPAQRWRPRPRHDAQEPSSDAATSSATTS